MLRRQRLVGFPRTMRIFLYEYTTAVAGSKAGTSREPLLAEGKAMLGAVLQDFTQIAGIRVVTLPSPDEQAFRHEARRADFTLVIAPECDGILASLCEQVEQAGGQLLGPSSQAVRLTADKLLLSRFWRERQVPTPPCWLPLPGEGPPTMLWPAVYKPRHGAGSQATFLVQSPDELATASAQARAEGVRGDFILQPYIPGRAASIAWLVGPRQQVALPPAEQILTPDGRFHYQGGRLPLEPALARRAVRLTQRAIAAVPGLLGYVGVDIILGPAEDGSQDQVIELNPRLTTSYIGLRALAKTNLAQGMLALAQGEPIPQLTWHSATIEFQAEGFIRSRFSREAHPTAH